MKYGFLIAVLLFSVAVTAQPPMPDDMVFSRVTTKDAKAARYRYLADTAIKQYLLDPLNDDNEGEWNDALWAMELLQYKDDFTRQKLGVAWSKAAQLSTYFQKNLLETTFSLYKTEFKPQALQLMQQTKSVSIFIRCAEYVLRADSVNGKSLVAALIKQKFPYDNSLGMQLLKSRIYAGKPQPRPPMLDIFDSGFLSGKTVIFSLQRSNRDYAGLVLIRKPDGTFLKDSTGGFFHTSQLARAITNYPFYITNGNTPQGILRFNGFDVSRLLYIGPTQNLQLQLPFEITASSFFADSNYIDSSWNLGLYASLLPPSWKNYNNIYESFYAGQMGRNAIIMHGTTIDPEFYKDQPYYPQTPSMGCLCSFEDWSEDGYRTVSNQQKIVNAINNIGSSEGYVVVIDIDNKKSNVDISEVLPLLR
ncbi:hypothetical protein [Parafilimonas sp.]|uniref:hypothetical protein n=1 Tax=Parafilimonas sp. TaxID=1969739 RepID=UPI003F7F297C